MKRSPWSKAWGGVVGFCEATAIGLAVILCGAFSLLILALPFICIVACVWIVAKAAGGGL